MRNQGCSLLEVHLHIIWCHLQRFSLFQDLKLKRVKELCMEQLRSLSDEQISDAIAGNITEPPPPTADSNTNHKQFEGAQEEEAESSEGGGGPGKAVGGQAAGETRVEDLAQEEERGEIVIDVSDVSNSSMESDADDTNADSTTEDGKQSVPTHRRREHMETSLNTRLATPTRDEKNCEDQRHNERQTYAMDENQVFSQEDSQTHSQGEYGNLSVEKHEQIEQYSPQAAWRVESITPLDDGGRSVETYPQVKKKHTLAASQFLEMELRRRALEAEVRRNNDDRLCEEGGGSGSRGVSHSVGENSERTPAVTDGGGRGDRGEVGGVGGRDTCAGHSAVDPPNDGGVALEGHVTQVSDEGNGGKDNMLKVRELLEERLRQRALQAMLKAKKKNNKPH